MIKLSKEQATDIRVDSSREWYETNGTGGYASGTVSGSRSRRYQSLLTIAAQPPVGRIKCLAKFDEAIILDGRRFELSANHYPGKVYPEGYKFTVSFALDPFPVWTYDIEGLELEKRLFMPYGSNAVVVRWKLKTKTDKKVGLELLPLAAFKDHHHLCRESSKIRFNTKIIEDRVELTSSESEVKLFFYSPAIAEETGYWYNNFELAIEKERGFDFREDLYQPFKLVFDMSYGSADLIISTEEKPKKNAAELERNERSRRVELIKSANAEDAFSKQLVLAADQFIVKRREGHTVIAGYPWFSDWGRDTMIALPGLTLATDRPQIAKSILQEYAEHISEGMLPNRFPDEGGQADYNTVDASLWYFEAIRAYFEKTGDEKLIKDDLYDKLADIAAYHVNGTRYNIHLDTDGLLYAGEQGSQLTWMDAKYGNEVFTPRIGKPVEVQALWYNALRTMSAFAGLFGFEEDATRFTALADLAKLSFNGLFWNDEEKCLFDVIENGHRDGSVRPNQIFAVSLHYPILNEESWLPVVEKVRDELLTPVGLRSLSPKDAKYEPIYTGSPFERDSSYHQGTVWAWPIGHFIDAYRKVFPENKAEIKEMLSGFERHLSEAGLGSISEIFDGDPPHTPRGCPAQAWSVAEVLRVMI